MVPPRMMPPGDRAATGTGRDRGFQVNGKPVDLTHTLAEGDALALVTLKGDDPTALDILRHSGAHMMAQAS